MPYINTEKMDACFRIMESVLTSTPHYQPGDPATLSLHAGGLWRWEGYKYEIFKRGHELMMSVPWEKQGVLDTDVIPKAANQALNIIPADWSRQENLVDWQDTGIVATLSDAKLRALKVALLKLYTTSDEEGAFNALVGVFGQKYALITYFYFLKDSSRFVIMRPIRFAEQFSLIGVPTACTARATWKNYQEFNAILGEVRDYLADCLDEDVTLLDAHSFVWSLYVVAGYRNAGGMEIPDAPEGESYVATESRRIAYYTTKYERDPKLRREAIRIHGYRCAACGLSFEEKYGPLGHSFIEVHHLKPLYSLDEEVEVNPMTDMACLCANCHRMIHRRKNAILTVEDLKALIRA